MTALVMAAAVGLALAAVPAGVTSPLWWPQVRVWLPSLYRRALQVVASVEVVARVEQAAHADAERQRRVGEHRAAQARRDSRPAAVARRARRGWAA